MDKYKILQKQKVSELEKQVEQMTKTDYCYLCEKKITSCCNSHVVPQFILKEIAENGVIYYGQSLHKDNYLIPTKSGIKNAFTFKLICRDCDKKQFENYESPEVILDFNKFSIEKQKLILLEIAIKSHLSHINTKLKVNNYDIATNPEKYYELSLLDTPQGNEIDINEHKKYIKLLKKYRKSSSFPFEILYNELLDYKVNIATQTLIAYIYDLNGNQLYYPNDTTLQAIFKYFYLVIFPYKNKTRILFYIEKSSKYLEQNIIDEFYNLNEEEKLHFIFMSLIIFDEQFYINTTLHDEMIKDVKLTKLYRDIENKFGGGWENCKEIMNFREYNNYLLPKF